MSRRYSRSYQDRHYVAKQDESHDWTEQQKREKVKNSKNNGNEDLNKPSFCRVFLKFSAPLKKIIKRSNNRNVFCCGGSSDDFDAHSVSSSISGEDGTAMEDSKKEGAGKDLSIVSDNNHSSLLYSTQNEPFQSKVRRTLKTQLSQCRWGSLS